MPRQCSVCVHPQRLEIESAVIAGTSLRNISKQFLVGYVSIQRHISNHLVQAIKEVKQEQTTQSVSNAFDRMAYGEEIVCEIIVYSWDETKMPELALKALAEYRRQVELRAKLEGDLDAHSITITSIPEWQELRALLLTALSQHPQAKMAVIRALEAYDRTQIA